MTNPRKPSIIRELRDLMPTRPLTLSESYQLAEQQASKALTLANIDAPHVSLDWVVDLPRVDVHPEPRFKMSGFSGATTFTNGRYLVLVSKNDGMERRRFTLAHELKHVLDWTAAPVIHRKLGYGDAERQNQQIEQICNHFAACLLMPRAWINNAWRNGWQDVSTLAALFRVSDEAMDRRLRFLGYLDEQPKPVRAYFRLDAFAPSWLVAEQAERYRKTSSTKR